MLVSFSGIGGSGKTTQIAALARSLRAEGRAVEVVALRDLFLWPRLAGVKNRGSSESSGDGSGERPRAGYLKHALRACFYLADFWRIYLARLAPASRRSVVIVDRYWYDFVVELALSRGELDGLLRLLLRLVPRPHAALWFTLPPEVAIARKYEVPLAELETHVATYEAVFALVPKVAVDASATGDSIQQLLAAATRGLSPEVGLLSADARALRALAAPSWRPFLRSAARNRALLRALQLLSEAPGARAEFSDAYALSEERARQRERAEEILSRFTAETGVRTATTKRERGVELGSDVDVIFESRGEMADFTAWAESEGARVEKVDEDKADIFFDGALGIDAHVGMTFSGFAYLSPGDFFEHPAEAEALTVIAHAACELTVITAGDAMKIAALGNLNRGVMEKIARASGWSGLLRYWNRATGDLALRDLPERLPAWRLLAWRLRRYAHRMDGRPFADLVVLAKGIRARLLGHIPYHEPWYRA